MWPYSSSRRLRGTRIGVLIQENLNFELLKGIRKTLTLNVQRQAVLHGEVRKSSIDQAAFDALLVVLRCRRPGQPTNKLVGFTIQFGLNEILIFDQLLLAEPL